MSDSTASPQRAALSHIMLASARNVRAVLAGQSLSEALAATAAPVRAAAQAVSFHAMRQLGLAQALKQALVRKAPADPLFDALLLVALTLLETAMAAEQEAPEPHVPVYAVHTVVDQAVRAAQTMPAYKSLMNAVLRRYTREREGLLAQALRQETARWNHPAWWIRQLRQAYPQQWQALLQAAQRPGPLTLRINPRRATVPSVLAQWREAGLDASPVGASGLVLHEARPLSGIPGFEQGWWSVQDASAQRAAALLAPADGERVLDACAAPGGKTAHLLELADIELLALDRDAGRLERVGQNLDRLGLRRPQVALRCADAADLASWWDQQPYDAVLADVPCTASGIVRRHPDIRWLRRESDVASTAALQRGIIHALWQTVRPGGRMLYATCSVFPQEGEQQAAWFAARHDDAVRLDAPGQLLPLTESGQAEAHDGFFYALFAKRSSGVTRPTMPIAPAPL